MTVRDLMSHLKWAEPDREVWLSIDGEGNNFNVLTGVSFDAVVDEDGVDFLNEDDELQEGYKRVLVLWPEAKAT